MAKLYPGSGLPANVEGVVLLFIEMWPDMLLRIGGDFLGHTSSPSIRGELKAGSPWCHY